MSYFSILLGETFTYILDGFICVFMLMWFVRDSVKEMRRMGARASAISTFLNQSHGRGGGGGGAGGGDEEKVEGGSGGGGGGGGGLRNRKGTGKGKGSFRRHQSFSKMEHTAGTKRRACNMQRIGETCLDLSCFLCSLSLLLPLLSLPHTHTHPHTPTHAHTHARYSHHDDPQSQCPQPHHTHAHSTNVPLHRRDHGRTAFRVYDLEFRVAAKY